MNTHASHHRSAEKTGTDPQMLHHRLMKFIQSAPKHLLDIIREAHATPEIEDWLLSLRTTKIPGISPLYHLLNPAFADRVGHVGRFSLQNPDDCEAIVCSIADVLPHVPYCFCPPVAQPNDGVARQQRDSDDHQSPQHNDAKSDRSVSEEKYAYLLQKTALGAIEWSIMFQVADWNPAAEAIFGYSREEALGQHALDVITPKHLQDQIETIWDTFRQPGVGASMVTENRTKDNRIIYCEWFNTPLVDGDGICYGVMSLVRDVTEQQHREDEQSRHRAQVEHLVQECLIALAVTKERADEASETKATFLANMSHELRTPLNAILSFTSFLSKARYGSLNQRQQGLQERILSNAKHLLNLIDDILDVSKIESDCLELDREPTDLVPLLHDVLVATTNMTKDKDVTLELDAPEVLPSVLIDKMRIRQVLLNLLSNASKFTDQGRITLRVQVAAPMLYISVEDTGIGIAPEHQRLIFEEFRQVKDDSRREHHGTGLGLTISRRLVEMHGGQLWVESALRIGSTFSFTVPFATLADTITFRSYRQAAIID